MTQPHQKSVLIVGIDPKGTTISGPAHVQQVAADPALIVSTVKAQVQRLSTEAGYDVIEMKQIRPADFDAGLIWIREKLGSQHWDVFVVGGGIRQTPDFTPFFEQVVNAAREITPTTKLGFNTKPDDLYETVVRAGQLE